MRTSTVWLAEEESKISLEGMIHSLTVFYNQNRTVRIEGEEDYEFTLGEIENDGKFFVGRIYKYYKDRTIKSWRTDTREILQEKTEGHLILADAYFGTLGNQLIVEEKPPHFGHLMISKILSKMSRKINARVQYEFEFPNSRMAIEEIFRQITEERIKLIRFKNISENPDPTNENLKRFENLVKDTKSKEIEFSNSREGINPNSTHIQGGKLLVEESKSNARIETETKQGEPKVYDTSEARNKIREKVQYKGEEDRKFKLKEAFLKLLRKE